MNKCIIIGMVVTHKHSLFPHDRNSVSAMLYFQQDLTLIQSFGNSKGLRLQEKIIKEDILSVVARDDVGITHTQDSEPVRGE